MRIVQIDMKIETEMQRKRSNDGKTVEWEWVEKKQLLITSIGMVLIDFRNDIIEIKCLQYTLWKLFRKFIHHTYHMRSILRSLPYTASKKILFHLKIRFVLPHPIVLAWAFHGVFGYHNWMHLFGYDELPEYTFFILFWFSLPRIFTWIVFNLIFRLSFEWIRQERNKNEIDMKMSEERKETEWKKMK